MEGRTQIQAGRGRPESDALLGRGQGQVRGGQGRARAARGRCAGGARRRRGGQEGEECCPKRIFPGASGLCHAAGAAVCVSDPMSEGRAGKKDAVGESAGRCGR